MKRLFLLLCFLGSLLASGGLSHALTIPASEDTTSFQKQITAKTNSDALLTVDATHTGFVYFNLDDIPKGTAIRLARLRVYLPSMTAKGNGISVHLVTSQWNETLPGAEPKYDATPIVKMDADNLGSRRFVTVDVTAVVQNWINLKAVNEGFALVAVPKGSTTVAPASVTIAAKDGISSGLPAHLEIELADETKVGPAGPTGAQGPRGLQGVAGAQGPKGDTGVQGPIGLTGAKGDTGPAGATGAAGASGKTILSGTIAPGTGTGGIGDFYLNTATTTLYGPKTDKGWGTPKSLVGPAGPTGATGAQGLKGNTGATGPQGPQGLTGAQGSKGDTGAAGVQGPKGDSGIASGGSITMTQLPNELANVVNYFTPSVSVIYDPTSGTLQPTAGGVGTLSYQWLKDNRELENATSLQLTGANLASGSYALRVSNGVLSTVSRSVYCTSAMLGMVNVFGGTLAEGSELAGQVVSDFKIAKTEVTWGEWKTVRDWAVNNGYDDLADVGVGTGDNYPVTNVSRHDVVKWCNALSEKEGKTPVYQVDGATFKSGDTVPTVNTTSNGYRLPTEAEWEWAARGGRQTHGYTYSGSNDLNAVGWFRENSGAATHEVGTKAANELGLYDMSGNVSEWCESWYFSEEALLTFPVLRGGAWTNSRDDVAGVLLAVASRALSVPERRRVIDGFRVACNWDMVSVLGGTLPKESELAGQVVQDFAIGKTEVTWGEWKTVRDWAVNNGYDDLADVGAGNGDNYPVTNVSWYDVVKWCNARSEKDGKTPVYQINGTTYKSGQSDPNVNTTAKGYRLPTEVEWEWAARGGRQTHGYIYSGSNDLDAIGWTSLNWNYNNYSEAGNAVKTKAANELGIYDMTGNVWEWCEGFYSDAEGSGRALRGAAYYNWPIHSSVAYRHSFNPEIRNDSNGFRVALSSVP